MLVKPSPPAPDFPFRAGDDVVLTADPAHRDTVVEVHGQVAELRNGLWYAAHELRRTTDPEEEWIDLPAYDGRYRLSSHGKLLATDYRRQGRARLFALSKASPDGTVAYSLPDLNDEALEAGEGKPSRRPAAQLVAEHFIGPPPGARWHVGYKDGDRGNLRKDNLFWYNPRQRRNDDLNQYLNRRTVLSQAQAQQAEAAIAAKTPYGAIAAELGVSEEVIKALAKQARLAKGRPDEEKKQKIVKALREGARPSDVARAHDLSRVSVWRIQKDATPAPPAP